MKIRNMARGIFRRKEGTEWDECDAWDRWEGMRSCRDVGFGEGLPAVIVNKAFHQQRWVLDAVDYLGRRSGIGDNLKPVPVFQVLGRLELRLRKGHAALAPCCANGFYLDVAFDFAGGVLRFDIVAFVEVIHFGRMSTGLFFKFEDGINAFAPHLVSPVDLGGIHAVRLIVGAVAGWRDVNKGEVFAVRRRDSCLGGSSSTKPLPLAKRAQSAQTRRSSPAGIEGQVFRVSTTAS